MTQRNTSPEGQKWWSGEYEPSPDKGIRSQVALYEATNGREGNLLEGRPVVILTTLGAQSQKVRKNPIMRIVEGGTYVAVASAAGAPRNPSWYNNLHTHPEVLVQDGSTVNVLRAREVLGEEKRSWWQVAERFWPHFPEYRQRAAGRDIPVILLEPVSA